MEMLACSAVKIAGSLYTGFTHREAMEQFGRHVPVDMEDGYITTENRFVDRVAAFRIAKAAGQLAEAAADPKSNLALYGMEEPPLNSSMVVVWGTQTFAGVVQ